MLLLHSVYSIRGIKKEKEEEEEESTTHGTMTRPHGPTTNKTARTLDTTQIQPISHTHTHTLAVVCKEKTTKKRAGLCLKFLLLFSLWLVHRTLLYRFFSLVFLYYYFALYPSVSRRQFWVMRYSTAWKIFIIWIQRMCVLVLFASSFIIIDSVSLCCSFDAFKFFLLVQFFLFISHIFLVKWKEFLELEYSLITRNNCF